MVRITVSIFASLLLISCTEPPPPPPPTPEVTLSSLPEEIELSRDAYAQVPVQLTRVGGHSEAVVIKVEGLPDQVTADLLTIPRGASTGELMLRATKDAQIGTTTTLAMTLESGTIRHTASAVLRVVQGFSPSVTSPMSVPRGSTATLTVNLARASSYKDIIPVTIRGTNLVEATATASPTSSSVELPIHPTVIRAPAQIQATITVNGANHSIDVPLTIDVTPVAGDWDPAFGTDGAAAAKTTEQIEALAVASDGTVFTVQADAPDGFFVTRLSPTGQLSSTFGDSGGAERVAVTGGTDRRGGSVALQSDGRVIFAGASRISGSGSKSSSRVHVARLSATTGATNSDFASGAGFREIDLPLQEGGSWVREVDVAGDDSLLVTAVFQGGVSLIRLSKDGVPDTSFNGTGTLTFAVADSLLSSLPRVSTVLLPDGKIRIATADRDQADSSTVVAEVRQFTATGAVDTSFAADKRVLTLPAGRGFPESILLRDDGEVLIGAQNWVTTPARSSVVRFTAGGALDLTFGTEGEVTFIHGSSSGIAPTALATGPSDTLYGLIGSEGYRFLPDGNRDDAFGTWGETRVEFGTAIAVGGPGNMLLVGTYGGKVIRVLP